VPDELVVSNLRAFLGSREILRGVSLVCSAGEWLGVVGANGSGKSTLLRCISGQQVYDSGAITIGGFDLLDDPIQAKACFGLAIDAHDLPRELTGRQYLELIGSIRGAKIDGTVDRLVREFGLVGILDDVMRGYSFGTKQKIGIAGALIGLPKVLIFDESLNGLDPPSAWCFKKLLSEIVATGEQAVVMTTHSLETVFEWCDRGVVMAKGAVSESKDLEALRRAGYRLRDFEEETMREMVS
jgi:ABC-2 type transport system ATP-binding protein